MVNRLELISRGRVGGSGRSQRSWVDFVIDGVSLHDVLRLGDVIGCLGWGAPEIQASLIRQLLPHARSNASGHRVMIYVCPECGELGCGAVTVTVSTVGAEVVWKHFAFENDHEMTEMYDDVGPFRFASTDYREVLTRRTRATGT